TSSVSVPPRRNDHARITRAEAMRQQVDEPGSDRTMGSTGGVPALGAGPAPMVRPNDVVAYIEPFGAQYTPIPTRSKPGESMLARWPSECIHAACKPPALTPALPDAMFSPTRPNRPPFNRLPRLLCRNPLADMSLLQSVAYCARPGSQPNAGRPRAARS